MDCPRLQDLPPPPDGKTGWPWTEESPSPEAIADVSRWPSISLVTPSFNQGQFIEQTIRSVLLQGYPQLEYFVIDGGSRDETVDVLKKYERWLTGWVSEPDRGQSHAINKGFARCTGEVINWINSDDLLAKGALCAVGRAFAAPPETDIVLGRCWHEYLFDPGAGHLDQPLPSLEKVSLLPTINPVTQPSCFYRRSLLRRDPPLDESLHYTMDYELWAYLQSQGARWKIIDDVLSVFVFSGPNKTLTGGWKTVREIDRLYRRYSRQLIPLSFWARWVRYPLECWHVRNRTNAIIRKPLTALLHAYLAVLSPFYGRKHVEAMSWRWIPESQARWGEHSK